MTLRPALAAEAERLAALEATATVHGWRARQYGDSFAAGHDVSVIESDGQPVGVAVWMLVIDEAELLNIAVARLYQGRGLGRRLLQSVLADARAAGARRLFLEVREGNAPARALYRSLGFVETGLRKNYYPGDAGREHAVLMECTL
ncbi:ribosomal protein S18-alanine N-acetyltransferase [Crenobacter cavernae]|uniref:[Ribosomal protein bS18]-alanine N-acetyltransferase n=1 Tax=Crenobacter cavernae TaxID=2290923 RepID=A0A345Y6W0_9NEIS|nr:ribosomal protein S18-alanine N-acetyltransferase [Crenobacter cavernae]AXK39662.1 ribosomal-protein-alanine N-acetyltransferase [Crenobacter cavernae]